MDDDGYVNITGRIKDMVIRGGENIYPREIEEFLYTHPDILDAQVIGVPDAQVRRGAVAWVRLRDGAAELTAEAVREFAGGRLAHYKIPRYVLVVDEFPMTVTGKVRKVEMREKRSSPCSTWGTRRRCETRVTRCGVSACGCGSACRAVAVAGLRVPGVAPGRVRREGARHEGGR